MTSRCRPSFASASEPRRIPVWRGWLFFAAVVCLTPLAARAADAVGPSPDCDIPAGLSPNVMLSDADAAAQKGTGLSLPTPSTGLLQGPAVRLWDELKVQPRPAPGGTVTITIGRSVN